MRNLFLRLRKRQTLPEATSYTPSSALKTSPLSMEEVLDGYDKVMPLYPYIPSLSLWRAWEYAAYKRYKLQGPVLDIGCGDGQYFRLIWGDAGSVTGVDMDESAIANAKASGVYEHIIHAAAHEAPLSPASFQSAFANCSLEHMDHIEAVIANIYQALAPGGQFLLSIVTEKWNEWTPLPRLVDYATGNPALGKDVLQGYTRFHHVVNPLSISGWQQVIEKAGFQCVEQVPLVPEVNAQLFFLIDNLWHLHDKRQASAGQLLDTKLRNLQNFPEHYRDILKALMAMEADWTYGAGAVILARKPE